MEMGSELDYGVVDGMGERTEFHIDRVCSELGFGEFPEMNAEDYVLLQTQCIPWSMDCIATLVICSHMYTLMASSSPPHSPAFAHLFVAYPSLEDRQPALQAISTRGPQMQAGPGIVQMTTR